MALIDSHCHLDDPRFDSDIDAVIARAGAAGVDRFIVPSATAGRWPKLAALAARHPGIAAAYGIHPWYCSDRVDAELAALPARLNGAVAIGECGLDGARCGAPQDLQLACFRTQLRLAAELGLPLILHAVKSIDAVLAELRRLPGLAGVLHGFHGSAQQARAALDQGLYLGIGSAITRPQNERLRAVVAGLPVERLLLESDAPDQPPQSRLNGGGRGESRNEPAFLIEIADALATLCGMERAALDAQCNANVRELFSL